MSEVTMGNTNMGWFTVHNLQRYSRRHLGLDLITTPSSSDSTRFVHFQWHE